MNIAIIPARGGSERIKNKNIKIFKGKPIIYYSIKAAINADIFDKIIVSTDSKKIKKIANKFGAETPFTRPRFLSGNFVSTVEVVSHAVKWVEKNYKKPKYVCCIYPTAPLIMSSDLIKSYKRILSKKIDFVFSASKFTYPVQRGFYLNNNDSIKMINKKNYLKRSQDLEETYHDAGQFYWGHYLSWIKKKKIFDKNSSIQLIPRLRVQDIDNIEDWNIAEKLYNVTFNTKK